jgi:hypothetical protein
LKSYKSIKIEQTMITAQKLSGNIFKNKKKLNQS